MFVGAKPLVSCPPAPGLAEPQRGSHRVKQAAVPRDLRLARNFAEMRNKLL